MARLNKSDIIDYVSEEAYLSKRDARAAFEAIFEIISDALAAGSEVDIPNFGAIVVKERKEKVITNPGTGKKELVPQKKTAVLRLSKTLKDHINGK